MYSMTEQNTQNAAANRRTLRGVVVAANMKNTVTVAVDRYVKHPKYQKYQRRTKKYLAHDATGMTPVGANVSIQETAPISKRKRFTILSS